MSRPFSALARCPLPYSYLNTVAAVDQQPWMGTSVAALTHTRDSNEQFVAPLIYAVTADFFAALDIPLLAGRLFDPAHGEDVFPGIFPRAIRMLDPLKTYSIVIDRLTAQQLGWTVPQTAINQIIYVPLGRLGAVDQPVRIIGVVGDKPLSLTSSGANANMFVFVPDAIGFREILVRVSGRETGKAVAAIDATWNKLAPNVPLSRQFIDEVFDQSYATFTRISQVIAGLSILALVISMLGLFGTAFFIASRRRHEIGVRKTLGASTRQVAALLLRDFSKPIVIANLVAWPFAYWAVQAYLSVFVHRIAITPLPFIASFLIALIIAWAAVGGQTIRAARLRPATVLRYE